MQTPENIAALVEKYLSKEAAREEIELLNKWYHTLYDDDKELFVKGQEDEHQIEERIKMRLLATIQKENEKDIEPRHIARWKMPAAAAAILLLIITSVFFIITSKDKKQPIVKSEQNKPVPVNDIAPGGNKAILTLADGSSIILDSAANGTLTQQGSIKVEKLANGLLAYIVNGKQVTENDEAFYNTISTPRGGQYQLTLADGTMVWLNAASSIHFPVVFTGKERKVEITGEAYFEVAKNKDMPFKVKAAMSEIEVLGTHFNVNAYEDETSTKTTLLEGLVKISVPAPVGSQPARFLNPGQQAGINKDGNISLLSNVDVEEVMAWKNGRFQFNSSDLKTILRQVSRWYDVDIVYKENVNLHFTGQITRNANVSKVFEKLELTGIVNFKIEGRKIIVSE